MSAFSGGISLILAAVVSHLWYLGILLLCAGVVIRNIHGYLPSQLISIATHV